MPQRVKQTGWAKPNKLPAACNIILYPIAHGDPVLHKELNPALSPTVVALHAFSNLTKLS